MNSPSEDLRVILPGAGVRRQANRTGSKLVEAGTRAGSYLRRIGIQLVLLLAAGGAVPAQVVINEVLFRPDPSSGDAARSQQWVELFNKGADAVDLSGWVLCAGDGSSGASARQLPQVLLPAGGYLVVHVAQGTDRLDFADGTGDTFTQDTGNVWSPDMDEIGLYSPNGIVDFLAWSSAAVPYKAGSAHGDAVAAGIWSAGAALAADGITVQPYEKPRPVEAGTSVGRDPDSTDTNTTADFEPHGGVGALDSSPNRQNLDTITIDESDPAPAAAPGARARAAADPKKWTVMLYFNADNNLEKYIYGNVQEIEGAGASDSNVNFVLMYDGKRFSRGTQRGLIRAGGDPTKLTLERVLGESAQIGERDMGDPQELSQFIAWAKANYPAEHYALILSAHGDGWKSYGPDETSKGARDSDFLYMGELRTALAGQHFDLIGFDACMMAGIEVADQVRDFTDYYVASEEVIPGYGYPYDTFAAELKNNPGWSGLDLGRRIVELYASRYTRFKDWTLSLIDERRLIELNQQVDAWSILLKTGAGLFQTRDNAGDNAQVLMRFDRVASQEFHDRNFVDLYDLAKRIRDDGNLPACVKGPIPNILSLIDGQVVATERHSADIAAAKGLHIYFPRNRKRSPETWADYDLPSTRATDGDSRLAVYAQSHDQLPLKAMDREDGGALNPRTEWPEPATPQLRFVQNYHWAQFLERYYHPVADNRILYGVGGPGSTKIYPTSTGGGACSNPQDQISVPVGYTVYFSGAGSSDADQADLNPAPGVVVPIIVPTYHFWDMDALQKGCNPCIAPYEVPPGADAGQAANDNMDADQDLPNSTADEKDAVGPQVTKACTAPGSFTVTLMVWDDNHLYPSHNTLPDAGYVHPQSNNHQSVVNCTDLPVCPTTGTLNLTFQVIEDLYDSARFVALTQGMLTMTRSGAGGAQVSVTGDRNQLVPASGPFDAAHCSFSLVGVSTGPVAGFPNVKSQYDLAIGGAKFDTVSGTYKLGLDNTLNNEPKPITYKVTGTVTNAK